MVLGLSSIRNLNKELIVIEPLQDLSLLLGAFLEDAEDGVADFELDRLGVFGGSTDCGAYISSQPFLMLASTRASATAMASC